MDKSHLARLILLEIEAVNTGDYEGKVVNLLTMVNEVMRTASSLAEKTLEDVDYVKIHKENLVDYVKIHKENLKVLKHNLINVVKKSKDSKRFL